MADGGAERARRLNRRNLRPLERACFRLLAWLCRRSPCLLPEEPLAPGTATAPIRVPRRRFASLVNAAAAEAALTSAGARVPSDPTRLPRSVLWEEGADALLVEVGRVDVQLGDGVVSVLIPVRCDQLAEGAETVAVDFVVGTPERPTGLLAAAMDPRGPRAVVGRWGEALTALAWQAVLESAGGVAGAAGMDHDGAPLVPVALTAGRTGVAVVAQARHAIDRVRPSRVVRGDAEARP
jgi:hypothetical protein